MALFSVLTTSNNSSFSMHLNIVYYGSFVVIDFSSKVYTQHRDIIIFFINIYFLVKTVILIDVANFEFRNIPC